MKANINNSNIQNTISMMATYDCTNNSTTDEHDRLLNKNNINFPTLENFLGPNFRYASSSERNIPGTNLYIMVHFVFFLKFIRLHNLIAIFSFFVD